MPPRLYRRLAQQRRPLAAVVWLYPHEAATLAGVHPETIRQWTRTGQLPCRRTSDGWRLIRRTDLDRYLADS